MTNRARVVATVARSSALSALTTQLRHMRQIFLLLFFILAVKFRHRTWENIISNVRVIRILNSHHTDGNPDQLFNSVKWDFGWFCLMSGIGILLARLPYCQRTRRLNNLGILHIFSYERGSSSFFLLNFFHILAGPGCFTLAELEARKALSSKLQTSVGIDSEAKGEGLCRDGG